VDGACGLTEADLPKPALDLLEVGRRYFDVDVHWVPPGSGSGMGRMFGFWRVEVGPKGWRAAHRRPAVAEPYPKGGVHNPPASAEWTDSTETIRSALAQGRSNWPQCVPER
jgi:hypothetical protein